ncbi:hypothetical protein DH2020_042421 [Rehmannia glutinosa]|uniref:BHLH domain-containing protein n=1 Tax=Rehmannia glutinosa TaxID=99300 RepID=A0ABR0UNV9_REHGL
MAALSYYSNWAALQQLDSDLTIIEQLPQSELVPDQLDPWSIENCLFDPNDLFYSETPNSNPNSLPYDFSNGITQPFEPIQFPKRQKGCHDYEEINYSEPAFYNTNINCPTSFRDFSPPENPVFQPKKETTGGGGLSAQSIAARQRRRKITEKTQELGKLVPGGHKMNTAEMLQAAYKYIKFLKAQVGILEFVGSFNQENGEPIESDDEELQVLLESAVIQEKLYSTEKCLVSQKFVQELSYDDQIVKSNPQLVSIVKQEH